jgi:hypothetical protein
MTSNEETIFFFFHVQAVGPSSHEKAGCHVSNGVDIKTDFDNTHSMANSVFNLALLDFFIDTTILSSFVFLPSISRQSESSGTHGSESFHLFIS